MNDIVISEINKNEYQMLGKLMVQVYASLKGFPSQLEQPDYYHMLANIGNFNEDDDTSVFVAISADKKLLGGVVYFSDMAKYGSGGTATLEKKSSGIRLLAVAPNARKMGVAKALTHHCIQQAINNKHDQIILHTTQAMKIAWKLYQSLGFIHSPDLDFFQEDLPVYGFRLNLVCY